MKGTTTSREHISQLWPTNFRQFAAIVHKASVREILYRSINAARHEATVLLPERR